MNKKIWRNLAIIGGVVAVALPIPILATMKQVKQEEQKSAIKYNFNNQLFNSKQEIYDYVDQYAINDQNEQEIPITWTLNVDNKLKEFNSPQEVNQYLENMIHTYQYETNKNHLKTNNDGSLLDSEIRDLYIQDENNQGDKPELIRVYRGKNNSIFKTEKEAKDSYLTVHNAYCFNNIFFNSKEELSNYLDNELLKQTGPKINAVVLKDRYGNYSQSIPVTEFQNPMKPETLAYLKNFIHNNHYSYFKFKNENNVDIYVDENNFSDSKTPFEPNFVTLNANKFKGNYIVYLDKDDGYDLLGPYYVQSGATIESMTDVNNWRKVDGTDEKFIDNSLQLAKITNFFNAVVSQDSNIEFDPEQISFFNVIGDGTNNSIKLQDFQREIDDYFHQLKTYYYNTYNSLQTIYKTMIRGKRYSEFLKLPILFIHTLDRLVRENAKQDIIDLTRIVYTHICQYYDWMLTYIIPSDLLLNADGIHQFSFVELYGVNNKTLDLNYDVDNLVDYITKNYPNLIKAIDFISYVSLFSENLYFLNSVVWDRDLIKNLFKINIEPKEERDFEKIWNLFTCEEDEIEYFSNAIHKTFSINNEYKPLISPLVVDNSMQRMLAKFMDKYIVNYYFAEEKMSFNKNQKADLDKLISLEGWQWVGSGPRKHKIKKEYEYIKWIQEAHNNFNLDDKTTILLFWMYKCLDFKKINFDELNNQNYFDALMSMVVKQLKSMENPDLEKMLNVFDKTQRIINFMPYDFDKDLLTQNNNHYLTTLPILKQYEDKRAHTWIDVKDGVNSITSNSLGLSQGVIDIVNEVIQRKNKNWAEMKSLSKVVNKLTNLSMAIPFVSIAFDIIFNIYQEHTFSYTFKNEDVQYVWNGGKEDLYFYGLIATNQRDIKSMKLLEPIEVIKPRKENNYYYNGNNYYSLEALKEQQLKDILNGTYLYDQENNKSFDVAYSLIPIKYPFEPNHELIADTLEELDQKVIKHIQKYIQNNFRTDSPIVSPSKYIYDGNFIYDVTKSKNDNIKNIIDNINPTLIVQKPVLETGDSRHFKQPIINNNGHEEDNSIPFYKLPYRSFTKGNENYNNADNYIILDSNKINNKFDYLALQTQVADMFYDSFNVDSKLVNKDSLLNESCFSKLTETVYQEPIYMIVDKYHNRKFFLNKNDALKSLYLTYDYHTYYKKETFETIWLGQYAFDNQLKYLEFIDKYIKEVNNEK